MKDHWSSYPLTFVADVMASTVGGLASLIAALWIGALLGLYILEGYFEVDSLEIFFGVFGLLIYCLSVACLQLWGLAYFAIIIWMTYTLLFEDTSRLAAIAALTPLTILLVVVSLIIVEGLSYYLDKDVLIRALLVSACFGIPCLVLALLRKRFGY